MILRRAAPEWPRMNDRADATGTCDRPRDDATAAARGPVSLTVIVPAFNEEPHLERAVRSYERAVAPACPDHEAVGGSIDLMFDTVTFSFRFDCETDDITYFYFMEGDVAWQHMSGDFFSLDGLNVQQNHGTWDVTK